MQFGIYLNTQAPPDGSRLAQVYYELFETVALAEDLGFDLCFLPEHHQQPDGYLPSPFVMAAAIASRTSRIRIATGIHILPLWHPLRVAEDVAVLDVLSGGRFVLGAGLGLVEREFHQFGIDLRTAVSRFEEQLEIIRRAWRPAPVTFHGQHFDLDEVPVTPRPGQADLPIILGGMSDRSVERAGRLGDGWLTDPLHSITSLERWAGLYRAAALSSGRTAQVWLQRDCWVAEDTDTVVQDWAPWLVEDWRFYFQLGLFSSGRFNPAAEPWIADVRVPEDINYDMLAPDRVLAGSPEEVTVSLASAQERLNPDVVALRFRYPGGPSHTATLGAIRRFGERVLPQFR